MTEHLTVGKLVDILNDIDILDESEICFLKEKDDGTKEEVILNEFSISFRVGDNYKKPCISFIIGD